MNHEDTLVAATAAFERLTVAVALAINLGAYLFVAHEKIWAAGAALAAGATMLAAISQWCFRVTVNRPSFIPPGKGSRTGALCFWLASLCAFCIGASQT